MGLHDSQNTYGSWVDLVAETKIANDRGPIIKLILTIADHMADVMVSRGPSADQAFKGYTWGSELCQGVKVTGVEVSSVGA